ncbi:uncharacterized protein CTRU02_209839 [Colletotrichum truncatum]|uniref:Uncharacterized protein n=1 Tax=Colletotrichum truncatum TaxID=5467 RepID=A0ACC3YTN4_COLTU|nr:uncharacterized protein CTRU02_02411 [Colletotrichum truncatum]KAF6798437.1 hypothetical protein CTRU02_02411 [Colletotrichum truncatum]
MSGGKSASAEPTTSHVCVVKVEITKCKDTSSLNGFAKPAVQLSESGQMISSFLGANEHAHTMELLPYTWSSPSRSPVENGPMTLVVAAPCNHEDSTTPRSQ